MPPKLKEKLFRSCMTHECKQMAYFFHDKIQHQKADIGLMRKMICALNCSMFEPGAVILEKGREVESVNFVFEGYANLINTYKIKDDMGEHEYGYSIRIPERSWFGDYQVLMDVPSTWCMVAGKKKGAENSNMIKVMNIDAEIFRGYINEYPDFRRFVILRSTVRRAYFNYRMKLSSFNEYLKEKEKMMEETVENYDKSDIANKALGERDSA